jgi:hypothetical protein
MNNFSKIQIYRCWIDILNWRNDTIYSIDQKKVIISHEFSMLFFGHVIFGLVL